MAQISSIEIWKEFRGQYEVSNHGNVRRSDGRSKKASLSANGYMIFAIFINKSRTNILVHRAVMEAFVGPCPIGHEVNHIDGYKKHNWLENLEYVTRSENSKHAIRNGLSVVPTERSSGDDHWTRKHPDMVKRGDDNGARMHPEKIHRGSRCKSSKLTEDKVRRIKKALAVGIKPSVLGPLNGVTREAVNSIRDGKSWRHVQ